MSLKDIPYFFRKRKMRTVNVQMFLLLIKNSKVCFTLKLPLDVTSQILIVQYLEDFFSVSNIVKSVILVNYLCSLRRKIIVLAFFSSLYCSLTMLEL